MSDSWYARPDLVGALSLLSGNTFPDTPIPFPLSLTSVPIVGGLFSPLLFSARALALMLRQGTGPGTPPPDATVYIGDSRQRRTIGAIFSGALTGLAELYAPVAAALADIKVPVLVGWGDRDPLFPVEQAERTAAVANARACASSRARATSFHTNARPRSPARSRDSQPQPADDRRHCV